MSPKNMEYLVANNPNIPISKVELCPNTFKPIDIKLDEHAKKNIRKKYKIPNNKTIFLYGGNIGRPQGVPNIIKFIQNCDIKNAFFLIVGSGTEFDKLQRYFEKEKPNNAKLLKKLPKHDYELLANSCDVGLIFLDHRFTIPNFPSRLLSYMQASIPVLAATDVNTDIGKVIEEGKFGLWCESRDVDVFNQKIQQLCNLELRRQMGVNARIY